jgi:hypothetical protein
MDSRARLRDIKDEWLCRQESRIKFQQMYWITNSCAVEFSMRPYFPSHALLHAVQPAMPGGEFSFGLHCSAQRGTGATVLGGRGWSVHSRKPSLCESQTPVVDTGRPDPGNRSRKSSVLLGVHRRNMLFRSLDESLHHGFIPGPSHTEILPDHGPPRRISTYMNLDKVHRKRFGKVRPIDSFAYVVLQLKNDDPQRKMYEDDRIYYSREGAIYPDDRHFLVTKEVCLTA